MDVVVGVGVGAGVGVTGVVLIALLYYILRLFYRYLRWKLYCSHAYYIPVTVQALAYSLVIAYNILACVEHTAAPLSLYRRWREVLDEFYKPDSATTEANSRESGFTGREQGKQDRGAVRR